MNYPMIQGFRTPEKWLLDPPEHWRQVEEKFVKAERMKIIEFYRSQRGNQNGDMLYDIWQWSKDRLEVDHDYIQWLFPSNEPSMMNGDAPVLTKEEADLFCVSPDLQEEICWSLSHMLEFLDFVTKIEGNVLVIEPKDDNVPWWLRGPFNHNYLRVTRILKSLRLVGLDDYAQSFYKALEEFKTRVSANTWNYWESATFDPLW